MGDSVEGRRKIPWNVRCLPDITDTTRRCLLFHKLCARLKKSGRASKKLDNENIPGYFLLTRRDSVRLDLLQLLFLKIQWLQETLKFEPTG